MKQKQVKVAANGTKTTKKAPPKKVKEVVKENEEVEEVVSPKKIVMAKKPVNNKAAKNQKAAVKEEVVPKKVNKKATKVVKVVEEEPEEEEDEEVEQEEEEQEEEEEEQDDEAMEDEEDEQEEDENEDEEMEAEEEEEEEEDNNDEDEQNEQPTIPSKVKSGEIPTTVQSSKIIHITKLPKNCKVNDVVTIFEKYGKIDRVHMVTTAEGAYAHISYKTVDAAKAALAANKKLKIHNSIVSVKLMKEKDKTYNEFHVRNLEPKTSEEELREHFKSCGDIEQVKLNKSFAFIVFKDKSAEDAVLKLHNSVLNGTNILVVKNEPSLSNIKWIDRYDENRTVILKNKQGFRNLDREMVNKLENILSKYGEIERLDVLCKENSLAMVLYKTEEAARKAFELNSKTIQNFEFELDSFENIYKVNNNTIFVSNLPKDCTEDDLRKCFSKAGEISSILLKHGCATIRFSDSDGYCKSFLYTESIINRKMIFVEPYSIRKHLRLKSKQVKGFKRGAGKGYKGFKSKKPRFQ